MPTLQVVNTSDNFSEWANKTNAVINAVNNEGINEIVQIIGSPNNGDILVYNSTTGYFNNTGVDSFVNAIIANLASQPTNNILPFYLSQGMRTLF